MNLAMLIEMQLMKTLKRRRDLSRRSLRGILGGRWNEAWEILMLTVLLVVI